MKVYLLIRKIPYEGFDIISAHATKAGAYKARQAAKYAEHEQNRHTDLFYDPYFGLGRRGEEAFYDIIEQEVSA